MSNPAPRLFTPEILANPYPLYQSLRASDPVHWDAGMEGWLVTRYDDVAAGLRNPKLSATARNVILRRQISDPQTLARVEVGSQNMLFSDPPAHTRMRGLVNKAFTPRTVEAMTQRIQLMVDQLLDAAQARGSMDVIGDLAAPLPVGVIGAMLGFPDQDHGRLKGWSDAMAIFGNTAGVLQPELVQAGLKARAELVDYMRGILAQRRAKPEDDLLTALMLAQEAGDRLSEGEVYSNAIVLMFAGHETTTNLIGLGMLNLLQNPGQLAKLRGNPALLPDAVEELLRYDSPVQLVLRIALEDLNIGTTAIKKGGHRLVNSGGRQPRSGSISRSGPTGHPARQSQPPGLRGRHPFLPGGASGPARGTDRHRHFDPSLSQLAASGPKVALPRPFYAARHQGLAPGILRA
jgi:cytochrome P450